MKLVAVTCKPPLTFPSTPNSYPAFHPQMPNGDVSMCMVCTAEFSVVRRRHHCRACGKVVCSACSEDRVRLPYLGNAYARVCPNCFKLWLAENEGKSVFMRGKWRLDEETAVSPRRSFFRCGGQSGQVAARVAAT